MVVARRNKTNVELPSTRCHGAAQLSLRVDTYNFDCTTITPQLFGCCIPFQKRNKALRLYKRY